MTSLLAFQSHYLTGCLHLNNDARPILRRKLNGATTQSKLKAKLQPQTPVLTFLGLFSTVKQAVKYSAGRLIFTNPPYADGDDLR